jgi:hypothetical protein
MTLTQVARSAGRAVGEMGRRRSNSGQLLVTGLERRCSAKFFGAFLWGATSAT